MKKLKSTLVFLVLLSSGLFVSTVIDIMALHDIADDYVSQEVLSDHQISTSHALPDWSSCSLEWGAIHFSIIFQLVLTLMVIIVLVRIIKSRQLNLK